VGFLKRLLGTEQAATSAADGLTAAPQEDDETLEVDGESDGTEQGPAGDENTALWRWLLAASILAAGTAAAFLGWLEVCEQAAVGLQTRVEVVEVCNDAPVTDPRYLLALLVALVVLWPELSELSVGSISIKRRLAATETRQGALESDVVGLRQIVQFQANTTATASVQLFPTWFSRDDPSIQAALAAAPQAPGGDRTLAEMKIALIEEYERLRWFDLRVEQPLWIRPIDIDDLMAGITVRHEIADHWPEAVGLRLSALQSVAEFFTRDYGGPLVAVRAMRNSLAHGASVEDEDVATMYKLATALERLISQRLSELQGAQ
jgi:hypothetical protein